MDEGAPMAMAEVDKRWPRARVSLERDFAAQGWRPVFREHFGALHADDPGCPGWVQHIELTRACRCLRWDGAQWELTMDFTRRYRDMMESDLDITAFRTALAEPPPATLVQRSHRLRPP